MCTRRMLAEARVVCVRLKSNPPCCSAVRGPKCAVPDSALVGPICARRVLFEPRVMCVGRKTNPLCCPAERESLCAVPGFVLSGPCALDVRPSLGLCTFDVNRTRCAALLCVGLNIRSRIVLLPGLCALDVCWASLALCALYVHRTRCAAPLCVGPYVQSRSLLLPGLCALDVC